MAKPRTRLPTIAGSIPHPFDRPKGCAFHPRCRLAEPRCSEQRPALEMRGGAWPMACLLED